MSKKRSISRSERSKEQKSQAGAKGVIKCQEVTAQPKRARMIRWWRRGPKFRHGPCIDPGAPLLITFFLASALPSLFAVQQGGPGTTLFS